MFYCGPGHAADLPASLRGTPCPWCAEAVGGDEAAVVLPHVADGTAVRRAWHADCLLRTVVGSVDHQRGDCACCRPLGGVTATAGLTERQEARMAARLFRRRRIVAVAAHVHPATAAQP